VFNLKRDERKPSRLEDTIDSALVELSNHQLDSDEAAAIVVNITKLCEAQATLKSAEKANAVSADIVATVIGNLVGIGMILGYEHVNVITSKALGFVVKPKV
jgi:hypothetical protein